PEATHAAGPAAPRAHAGADGAKLLGRAACQPRPWQRPRALATRSLCRRRGRDRDLGRRRRFGPEDVLLGLSAQQRLELLLLDRLALDQDLGQLLQIVPVTIEDLLGLDVGGLDDPPDLVVDLPRDLIGVVRLG